MGPRQRALDHDKLGGIGNLSISARYLRVVEALERSLPLDEVDWAITGSLGHRLQGTDVEIHDVDVQTDEAGAHEVSRRMARHVTREVTLRESALMRSHFGELRIAGVDVEVMGAIQKRLGDGTWGQATRPSDHRLVVQIGDLSIPVMSLAYEVSAYEHLGRHERAQLLSEALGHSQEPR